MKINPKIFSLPPYISTSWNNVVALYVKDGILLVSLVDGEIIEIPSLSHEIISLIFGAHAAHLEQELYNPRNNPSPNKPPNPGIQSLLSGEGGNDSPFRFAFTTLDGLGYALQHNPNHANAPDIPKEVLEKISAVAKILAPTDANMLQKPEPHCNCMYCQIARAVFGEEQNPEVKVTKEEETVSDEELEFQQWEIHSTGDKIFSVTNKLDKEEHYSVFLGNPVGCTCGKPGCEHILAVLKS